MTGLGLVKMSNTAAAPAFALAGMAGSATAGWNDAVEGLGIS